MAGLKSGGINRQKEMNYTLCTCLCRPFLSPEIGEVTPVLCVSSAFSLAISLDCEKQKKSEKKKKITVKKNCTFIKKNNDLKKRAVALKKITKQNAKTNIKFVYLPHQQRLL